MGFGNGQGWSVGGGGGGGGTNRGGDWYPIPIGTTPAATVDSNSLAQAVTVVDDYTIDVEYPTHATAREYPYEAYIRCYQLVDAYGVNWNGNPRNAEVVGVRARVTAVGGGLPPTNVQAGVFLLNWDDPATVTDVRTHYSTNSSEEGCSWAAYSDGTQLIPRVVFPRGAWTLGNPSESPPGSASGAVLRGLMKMSANTSKDGGIDGASCFIMDDFDSDVDAAASYNTLSNQGGAHAWSVCGVWFGTNGAVVSGDTVRVQAWVKIAENREADFA